MAISPREPGNNKQPATYNGLAGEKIACHMTAARFIVFRLPSRIVITTARLTAVSKERVLNSAHLDNLDDYAKDRKQDGTAKSSTCKARES
jgi:hypothetical protein